MRTFAHQRKDFQERESSGVVSSHISTHTPVQAGLTSAAQPRFGHDISRIPIYPLTAGTMQQKLAINTPGDQYEREADSVAEGVMRMPESGVGPGTAISIGSLGVQCKCSCDEEKQLQRKRGASTDSGQTATPPTVHEVLRSPGLPLDGATRAFMEPRFGYDFSAVRVHSGAVAEQSARDVNARAYTVGHNIVFGPNRLTPETHEGRKLIAHELTHVVQQAGGGKPHQQMPGSQPVQRFLGGPRLQRFGEPENVPEMTYISSVDPSGGDARKDAFLKEATNYHTNWGLKIKSVKSMEELVTDLSKAAGPVNRIRIVSHAWENRLFLGLFDGDSPGIDLKALKAIGESEVALLTELVGPVSGVTNVDANMILSAVRDANPDVIRPFHLDSGHALPKPINEFVVRAATLWMLVKGTGDAALKGPMRTAIESILRELRHRLARPAPDGAGVTETQAKALQDAIVALEPDPATPLKFDTTKETVAPIKTANTAFAAGFSDKLKKARGRFTDSSWIDIRGCKVGEQPAYMQAISAFFGGSAAKPHVSAPNWVQLFRALTYKELDDGDIASTAAATGVSDALDHWAAVTGVDAKMAGLDTAARLKVYLDEALVLPVRPAAKADNLRLYVKKSLKGKAFDKWLASQWKPDAPGLKALKVAGLTSVDSRWVIGVSDKLTEDGVLIVAPDPDYKTHIKEI